MNEVFRYVFTCFMKRYTVSVDTLWCAWRAVFCRPWDVCYASLSTLEGDVSDTFIFKRYQRASSHWPHNTMHMSKASTGSNWDSPIPPTDHGSPRTRDTAADAHREGALPPPRPWGTFPAGVRAWALKRAPSGLFLMPWVAANCQSPWGSLHDSSLSNKLCGDSRRQKTQRTSLLLMHLKWNYEPSQDT